MMLSAQIKSPDETLDYDLDYSRRKVFAAGEEVQTVGVEVAPEDGLTVESTQVNSGGQRVKVWLSGGENGETYTVSVIVTTNQGRVFEDCFRLRIRDC